MSKFKVGDRVATVSGVDGHLAEMKWHVRTSKVSPPYIKGANDEYLHRIVMRSMLGRPLSRSELVDHIDGDTWNNSRENLRVVSRSLNALNAGPHRDSKSPHKGVSWHPKTGKWHARIRVDGVDHSCGYHDDPDTAARAYEQRLSELKPDLACRRLKPRAKLREFWISTGSPISGYLCYGPFVSDSEPEKWDSARPLYHVREVRVKK